MYQMTHNSFWSSDIDPCNFLIPMDVLLSYIYSKLLIGGLITINLLRSSHHVSKLATLLDQSVVRRSTLCIKVVQYYNRVEHPV